MYVVFLNYFFNLRVHILLLDALLPWAFKASFLYVTRVLLLLLPCCTLLFTFLFFSKFEYINTRPSIV